MAWVSLCHRECRGCDQKAAEAPNFGYGKLFRLYPLGVRCASMQSAAKSHWLCEHRQKSSDFLGHGKIFLLYPLGVRCASMQLAAKNH